MNYRIIHDQIIARAISREIEGYVERHHILPKCLGGKNNPENIVKLTAKEHFIIHRLLVLIYPDNTSLLYACWAMCGLLNNQYRKDKRYISSSKIYERIKKEMSELTKQRLSKFNYWTGKEHSQESKDKQSTSAKIRNIIPKNEATRRSKISESSKNLTRTKEWNNNIAISKTGDKNPMFSVTYCDNKKSKKVLQHTLDDIFIREWCSSKEASDKLGLGYKAIMQCASGKTKTSQGFIWKYKQKQK